MFTLELYVFCVFPRTVGRPKTCILAMYSFMAALPRTTVPPQQQWKRCTEGECRRLERGRITIGQCGLSRRWEARMLVVFWLTVAAPMRRHSALVFFYRGSCCVFTIGGSLGAYAPCALRENRSLDHVCLRCVRCSIFELLCGVGGAMILALNKSLMGVTLQRCRQFMML